MAAPLNCQRLLDSPLPSRAILKFCPILNSIQNTHMQHGQPWFDRKNEFLQGKWGSNATLMCSNPILALVIGSNKQNYPNSYNPWNQTTIITTTKSYYLCMSLSRQWPNQSSSLSKIFCKEKLSQSHKNPTIMLELEKLTTQLNPCRSSSPNFSLLSFVFIEVNLQFFNQYTKNPKMQEVEKKIKK